MVFFFHFKSNDKKRISICCGQWPKCSFYSSGLGSMRLVFESKSLEGDQNKKIPCPQKEDLFCFVFSTL